MRRFKHGLAGFFAAACLFAVGCGYRAPVVSPPLDFTRAIVDGNCWIEEPVAEDEFKSEVRDALWRDDFDGLEKLAAACHAKPVYFVNGFNTWDSFIHAFDRFMGLSRDDLGDQRNRLTEWMIEKPNSWVAPLATAVFDMQFVGRSPQNADRVREELQAAIDLCPQDPTAYVELEQLAVIENDRDALERNFTEACKRDPTGYPAYFFKMEFMLDHVSRADAVKFMGEAADRTRDKFGDSYYALLAWHFRQQLHLTFGDHDIDISWPRARQGFIDFGRKWPHANGMLNAFAWMARKADDTGLARVLLARIGPNYDRGVWTSESAFHAVNDSVKDVKPSVADSDIPYSPALIERLTPLDELPAWRRNAELEEQIQQLLLDGQVAPLDELATLLRHHPPHFSMATGTISQFYDALDFGARFNDAQCRAHIEKIRRWGKRAPDSVAQRIALARLYMAYAWRARGGGYADTVTAEGWRLFGERLAVAEQALKGISEPDPVAAATSLTVARGQNVDADAMRALYEASSKRFPAYVPLLLERLTFLMPRWGGAPGEMEAFADSIVEKTRDEYGTGMYALFAADLNNYNGYNGLDLYRNSAFTWPKVRDGIKDLLARKKHLTARMLQQFADLASVEQDYALQLECLQAVNPLDVLEVAATRDEYQQIISDTKRAVTQKNYRELSWDTQPVRGQITGWGRMQPYTGRVIETTNRIPLGENQAFGMVVRLTRIAQQPRAIRIVYSHPTYTLPDGTHETEQVEHAETERRGSIYLTPTWYFTKKAPWEWVEGTYNIRVYVEDKLIAMKSFEVYKP